MGVEFGRTLLGTSGQAQLLRASDDIETTPIDCTISWPTVAAVNADGVTSAVENIPIKNGQKFLRYGQFMTRITHPPAQVVTQTGAGTLSGFNPLTGTTNTAAVSGGANTAAIQAAMDTIYGSGNTLVTGSGPFTVTFQGALVGYPVQALAAVGGAGFTFSTTTGGGDYGAFGPFDPSATDGRQTISRGNCFLMNETLLENGVLGFTTRPTNHTYGVIGGTVWKNKVIATAGTHSLANGPTWAELEAALPRLRYVFTP